MKRCPWAITGGELMIQYHDTEWGVPVHDDRKHFEFLVLEAFQAGLSWLTVLKKRGNFAAAFADFDPAVIAEFDDKAIEKLLNDAGIIRNRLKITATINNARRFLEVQQEYGSFDRYLWGFVANQPMVGGRQTMEQLPARTELSDQVSANLKQRGFKFVGSTIVYAHLQAVGIVNDHLVDCFRFPKLAHQPQ
ncbi:MAG: DNA-3-methyladenine glycosylase I [Dehalogenimonas sp.]|jgi:DNA-3-methyladenine glycosylase I|uniref:DNA-3-methyladenine glycosylase I n=1 Tax=Candidatus Dehalogenimonas loeffleri TaxID=3127115 RepID=A0ABZ2J1L1_9CHLR|nr:DNA-3-methyladenine glycosylase I [Dehalogenimonas sp.]